MQADSKTPFDYELAGLHEAAKIIGVSGARVCQLAADRPDFPRYVATLAQGRVWLADDLRRWASTRQRAVVRSRAGGGEVDRSQ